MDPVKAQAALAGAAKATMERIGRDQARASWRIAQILEHVKRELFDPALEVEGLLQRCRFNSSHIYAVFHKETGSSIGSYIQQGRLETALHLLHVSDFPVSYIALLVGFAHRSSLTRALKKWAGIGPEAFRERARRWLADRDPACAKVFTLAFWKEVQEGKADLRLLPDHLPEDQDNQKATGAHLKASRLEGESAEHMAAEVVALLAEIPPEERIRLVRHEVRFHSPEFFHLLGQQSLVEGRMNRQRGVTWAKLACECVESSADALGDAVHDLRALAWARLGNALRLVQDFLGAEAAFGRAAEETPREIRDPRTEAEILWLEAGLREHQRRFPEALERVWQACALAQEAGDVRLLVLTLIRRAEICLYSGLLDAASLTLREAEEHMLRLEDQVELQLIVQQVMAVVRVFGREYQAAIQTFPKIKELCLSLGRQDGWLHTRWLEGLASWGVGRHEEALSSFEEARAGFIKLGDLDNTAMVSLDLAELHLEGGRRSAAVRYAAQAIPVFEALDLGRETLATLNLLRQAIIDDEVTLSVLRQVRQGLADLHPGSWTALWARVRVGESDGLGPEG